MANADDHQDPGQNYIQLLYKLIPVEITAAYLAIYSVLNPLNAFGEPNEIYIFGALVGSTIVLAAFNYAAFPALRNIHRRDVRIYVSLSFLVWVIGTSVDFWVAFFEKFELYIPHQIFLVIVILWALATTLFLKHGGTDELQS